jgi:hypothetical protein
VLMAITEFFPFNHYKYKVRWLYDGNPERPECNKKQIAA